MMNKQSCRKKTHSHNRTHIHTMKEKRRKKIVLVNTIHFNFFLSIYQVGMQFNSSKSEILKYLGNINIVKGQILLISFNCFTFKNNNNNFVLLQKIFEVCGFWKLDSLETFSCIYLQSKNQIKGWQMIC